MKRRRPKMARPFEIKKAAELLDGDLLARWEERRALDPFAWAVLEAVLGCFVAAGGPVSVGAIAAHFPGRDAVEVSGALGQLDEKDLILLREGRVVLAYPFAMAPTAFSVILRGGRERHAVCAIDALGVPALLGEPVVIRSRCHHCGEPLEIPAGPEKAPADPEIMVWVGERAHVRQKACSSL